MSSTYKKSPLVNLMMTITFTKTWTVKKKWGVLKLPRVLPKTSIQGHTRARATRPHSGPQQGSAHPRVLHGIEPQAGR